LNHCRKDMFMTLVTSTEESATRGCGLWVLLVVVALVPGLAHDIGVLEQPVSPWFEATKAGELSMHDSFRLFSLTRSLSTSVS
jgi:hypothetical protein